MIPIAEILPTRFDKAALVQTVNTHPSAYQDLVAIALNKKHPQAWRASWVWHHATHTNDERIVPYIDVIIDTITTGNESMQRELLKILLNQSLSDIQEGRVFDISVGIWEDVSLTPSVRITGLKHMCKVAKRHPDISNELAFFSQNHYLEPLSPGIRNSARKMIAQFLG